MYRKGFFKGWYYKQEKGGQAVAFIPAVHLSGDGKGTASIQVITEDNAWNFDFPWIRCVCPTRRIRFRLKTIIFLQKASV